MGMCGNKLCSDGDSVPKTFGFLVITFVTELRISFIFIFRLYLLSHCWWVGKRYITKKWLRRTFSMIMGLPRPPKQPSNMVMVQCIGVAIHDFLHLYDTWRSTRQSRDVTPTALFCMMFVIYS